MWFFGRCLGWGVGYNAVFFWEELIMNITLIKQPNPVSMRIDEIVDALHEGEMKLPVFQRRFVWDVATTASLLDSVLKGYPIGTFILWKTHEHLASVREIGDQKFTETPVGHLAQYVLDGQQRITSLCAGYGSWRVTPENKKRPVNYGEDIVVDIGVDSFDKPIVRKRPQRKDAADGRIVSLGDVLGLDHKTMDMLRKDGFSDGEIDTVKKYQSRFEKYQFSVVLFTTDSVDIAVEVFTRINTSGKKLTLFDLISAKTYDSEANFDMKKMWEKFKSEQLKGGVGYEEINSTVVLYLISLMLTGDHPECKRSILLRRDKSDVIGRWDEAVSAVESAIDYVRSYHRIKVSRLLPNDLLLVPIAFFIWKNGGDIPKGKQADYMTALFWKTALSKHYSSSIETAVEQDVKRVSAILEKGEADLSDIRVHVDSPEDLVGLSFKPESSICKAILCLLAHKQPKGLKSNEDVCLDNTNLQKASGKNYHHFFPKGYLQGQSDNANSMMNITLISEGDNKSNVMKKAPSVYIRQLEKDNRSIKESLASHFIDMDYGVDSDDYERFLQMRAEAVYAEIEKRIKVDAK